MFWNICNANHHLVNDFLYPSIFTSMNQRKKLWHLEAKFDFHIGSFSGLPPNTICFWESIPHTIAHSIFISAQLWFIRISAKCEKIDIIRRQQLFCMIAKHRLCRKQIIKHCRLKRHRFEPNPWMSQQGVSRLMKTIENWSRVDASECIIIFGSGWPGSLENKFIVQWQKNGSWRASIESYCQRKLFPPIRNS